MNVVDVPEASDSHRAISRPQDQVHSVVFVAFGVVNLPTTTTTHLLLGEYLFLTSIKVMAYIASKVRDVDDDTTQFLYRVGKLGKVFGHPISHKDF